MLGEAVRVYFYLIVALGFILSAPAKAEEKCNFYGAEYVPQNQVVEESYDKNINLTNKTLSFVLRIEKGTPGGTLRNLYLLFDAYDKSGQKVSTMRFADAWSNGISRQNFSTYWGQYSDLENKETWKDFKPSASFYPIGVNKDLARAAIGSAPPLLIFPETFNELRYKSYNQPENWDYYIKFYTPEKIYPDFRGYDFWIRTKCGSEIEEAQ